MNKYFEVAQIFATLTGFLIVASSIFFSNTNSYLQQLNNPSSFILNASKDVITNFFISTANLVFTNISLALFFFVLSIISGVITIIFTYKGYKNSNTI